MENFHIIFLHVEDIEMPVFGMRSALSYPCNNAIAVHAYK